MGGVKRYTSRDISLVGTGKKKSLGIANKGPLLLLMLETKDKYSMTWYTRVFTPLTRYDAQTDFGVIDLKENPQIVRMASASTTPIPGIPFLVFFNNGVASAIPKARETPEDMLKLIANTKARLGIGASSMPGAGPGRPGGYKNIGTGAYHPTIPGRPGVSSGQRPVVNQPGVLPQFANDPRMMSASGAANGQKLHIIPEVIDVLAHHTDHLNMNGKDGIPHNEPWVHPNDIPAV